MCDGNFWQVTFSLYHKSQVWFSAFRLLNKQAIAIKTEQIIIFSQSLPSSRLLSVTRDMTPLPEKPFTPKESILMMVTMFENRNFGKHGKICSQKHFYGQVGCPLRKRKNGLRMQRYKNILCESYCPNNRYFISHLTWALKGVFIPYLWRGKRQIENPLP